MKKYGDYESNDELIKRIQKMRDYAATGKFPNKGHAKAHQYVISLLEKELARRQAARSDEGSES